MPRRTRPDPVCQMLGARVRDMRQERGLSRNQLQAACGQAHGRLSNIEHGLVNVTVGTLGKIASGLGTTPLFVMCIGDSDLEKFVEECRALPPEMFAKLARKLGVAVGRTALFPRQCPPEAAQ